jgi:glycine hydroxymethyltransferase
MVVNMNSKNITGKEAEQALEKAGISVSRSTIPNDPNPPMRPSGIRLGTQALTTRGMGEEEMVQIAKYINEVVVHINNEDKLTGIKEEVKNMCQQFPIPSV